MTNLILIALILLDLVLLGLFLRLQRRGGGSREVLTDLAEERRMLRELHNNVREEMDLALAKQKQLLAQVQKLAVEAEQEVRSGTKQVSEGFRELGEQVAEQLDKPLELLKRHQAAARKLQKELQGGQEGLKSLIRRAEHLCAFFDQKVPYESVLSEIEDKKYQDARRMLARGVSIEETAETLGMSPPEVRLVSALS